MNKHRKIDDAEMVKRKRMNATKLRKAIVKVFFYTMCLVALALTAFAIWSYL